MSPRRRLLAFLQPHRPAFARGLLCVVAASILTLAGPWVLKLAIDDLTRGVTAAKLRGYAAALLLVAGVAGYFRFAMRRIIIGASRELERELRNAFFAHVQRLDAAFFQRSRTGDLMSRATNDLNAVRMMIGPAVMYSASTGLTFVVGLAVMLSIDSSLTFLALLPLPLVSLSVWYFGRAIHERFERIQAQLSEISAITQESLSGVRVVRAYRQEPYEVERFKAANEEYVRRNRSLIALQGMYVPSMGLLMSIGAVLVLWLGSRAVIAGRMTVGELVAFNTYLTMMAWPMIAFGWVTNLLQRGMASWSRMLEVMDAQPAVSDAGLARGHVMAPVRGHIEFRHLTYAFGDRVVLRDVSAVMPAGSLTAIVGGTGSGKSTLLSLLCRLYDPPPGTVFVDGVDVLQIPLGTLRGAFGVVPQEPFLFSATIAENVAFGGIAAELDRAKVERAASVASLDVEVRSFPNGFDTMVGERGITLSGGQKQRVAIARALYVDPKVLILDDALSAVDTHTEEAILRQLGEVMRQRTALIVSHRVSTVRGADQILVLSEGRVAERGTHGELVQGDGLYAALDRQQQLEEELAAS